MWTKDIGRHEASNLPLLQVIFEVNLKLFDQNQKKQLLFVIRDYKKDKNNFEKIKEQWEQDLEVVWTGMKKHEKFSKSKLSDFFTFEYETLPSPEHEEQQFADALIALRSRF